MRAQLGIPFNPAAAAQRYEHSMGQAALPPHILRTAAPARPFYRDARAVRAEGDSNLTLI